MKYGVFRLRTRVEHELLCGCPFCSEFGFCFTGIFPGTRNISPPAPPSSITPLASARDVKVWDTEGDHLQRDFPKDFSRFHAQE